MLSSGIPSLEILQATRNLLEQALSQLSFTTLERYPMVKEAYAHTREACLLLEKEIKEQEAWLDDLLLVQAHQKGSDGEAMMQTPRRKLNDEEVDTLAAQIFTILMETLDQVVGKRGRLHV